MKKRMWIMLIVVGVLFGSIFIYKFMTNLFIRRYLKTHNAPIVTVSAMKVSYSLWQSKLSAIGTLRAIQGVNITTELAGMIHYIYFTSGTFVEAGKLLVQLNASSDLALLNSLQAQAELAEVNLNRDKAQYAIHAVSKATLDSDVANLKNLRAQVAEQTAIVAKKSIRAPFAGRLGISGVDVGQYLTPGDKVVTLQTLNPIFVDFLMPQQNLAQLKTGLDVMVTSDTYPRKIFKGKITTIDPIVDQTTSNVKVEATINNPNLEIIPGMFVYITIDLGQEKRFLTLPQTAISFNPYGELVYLINEEGKNAQGEKILKVHQAFIKTGEARGDQIAVLTGIKEGDWVVTSGQLKLKNGNEVVINNEIQPLNNPDPTLENQY